MNSWGKTKHIYTSNIVTAFKYYVIIDDGFLVRSFLLYYNDLFTFFWRVVSYLFRIIFYHCIFSCCFYYFWFRWICICAEAVLLLLMILSFCFRSLIFFCFAPVFHVSEIYCVLHLILLCVAITFYSAYFINKCR